MLQSVWVYYSAASAVCSLFVYIATAAAINHSVRGYNYNVPRAP